MLRETRKRIKRTYLPKSSTALPRTWVRKRNDSRYYYCMRYCKGNFLQLLSEKENILLFLGDSQIDLWNESLKTYANVEHPKERIQLVLGDLLDRFTGHGDLMKHAVFEIIKSNYLVENELKSIQQLQEGLSSIITEAKEAGKLNSQWDINIITSTIMSTYFTP